MYKLCISDFRSKSKPMVILSGTYLRKELQIALKQQAGDRVIKAEKNHQ